MHTNDCTEIVLNLLPYILPSRKKLKVKQGEKLAILLRYHNLYASSTMMGDV